MKKQDLKKVFSNPPRHFDNMVKMTLNNLTEEKGEIKMKKTTFKKGLIFAAMTILALSTTAFAMGKITSLGSTTGGNDYKSFPTAQKIKKDIGIKPQLVKNFDNGFNFSVGNISNDQAYDENGNVVRQYKSVIFDYTKNASKVMVTMVDSSINPQSNKNSTKSSNQDVELEYSSHISKFVPDDYIMTEQDKRDVESGKCTINVGSDVVKEQTVQAVAWQKDNISYAIIEMDNSLNEQELMDMAQEIIDAK